MWEHTCVDCTANVFGARSGFGMNASHCFPQGVLAVIPLIGSVVCVVVSKACAGCEVGLPLLCCYHCPVRGGICSPIIGLEALMVRFNHAPLPLSVCPGPKEVIAEASEARVFTEDLCATCVYMCGSAQKQPKVMSFSLCMTHI